MPLKNLKIGRSKVQFECCHKCTERQVGCHSTCEKYLETRNERIKDSYKLNAEYRKYYMQNKMAIERAIKRNEYYENRNEKRK